MESETLLLHPVAPYDFGPALTFLRQFPATQGEQRVDPSRLTKALREGGRTTVIRLTSDGSLDSPVLRCELTSEAPLTSTELAAIEDRLRFWLGLDERIAEFYALADPELAAVVKRLYGYHQVKFPSPWEHLCWAILAQRTPLRVAQSSKQRLIEAFPDNRLAVDGTDFWAFPDLAQLRSLSPERLGELVRNSRKTAYVHGAFEALDGVDESFLRSGPYDEVESFLLGIPGIGPWAASFVLIRGLGRTEKAPYDKESKASASRAYGRDIGEAEFRRLADRYGPWQGYWTHYLRADGLDR